MTGSLKVHFNREAKFDVFDFSVLDWREYVSLRSITPAPEQTPSPTMTKKGPKAQAQQQKSSTSSVPKSQVGNWGIAEGLMSMLEVCAVMLCFDLC
jgi:hypothetical protein